MTWSFTDVGAPHVVLSEADYALAKAEAERRDTTSVRRPETSVYDPGPAVSRLQHVRACVSELALALALRLEWTGRGQDGLHRADVGDTYEVRAVDVPQFGLIVRPKDPDRPFVLGLVDGPACLFRGWDWARDIRVEAHLRRSSSKSTAPFWVKPPGLLRPMSELRELHLVGAFGERGAA